MTPGYDMERLKQKLDETRAAIKAVHKHAPAHWLAWRLQHLNREIAEFQDVVFPPSEEKETK